MSGDLWVNIRTKRLARLDGHLEENVDFGFGILGRLRKGVLVSASSAPRPAPPTGRPSVLKSI